MGNEYFVTNDRDVQETTDMTAMSIPPGYDQGLNARVSATGKVEARKAATSALYNTYWNGGN
jgi:hypothetical protein